MTLNPKHITHSLALPYTGPSYLGYLQTAGPSNGRVWTLSLWARDWDYASSGFPVLLSGSLWTDANNYSLEFIGLDNNNQYYYERTLADGGPGVSLGRFRAIGQYYDDRGGWQHVVAQKDAASNSFRMWVNGVELVMTEEVPLLNDDGYLLGRDQIQILNCWAASSGAGYQHQGIYADVIAVDGQLIDPSYFGTWVRGIWRPKSYYGPFGAAGFHLKFLDPADAGTDFSGNGNNMTLIGTGSYRTGTPTRSDPILNASASSHRTDLTESRSYLNGRGVWHLGASPGDWTLNYVSHTPLEPPFHLYFEAQVVGALGTLNLGIIDQLVQPLANSFAGKYIRDLGLVIGASGSVAAWNNTVSLPLLGDGAVNLYDTISVEISSELGIRVASQGGAWSPWQYPGVLTGKRYVLAQGAYDPSGSPRWAFRLSRDLIYFTGKPDRQARTIDEYERNRPPQFETGQRMVWHDRVYKDAGKFPIIMPFRPHMCIMKADVPGANALLLDSARPHRYFYLGNDTQELYQEGLFAFGTDRFSLDVGMPNDTWYDVTLFAMPLAGGLSYSFWTGDGTGNRLIGHNAMGLPSMIWYKNRSLAGPMYMYHHVLGAGQHLEVNNTNAAQASNVFGSTLPTESAFTVGSEGNASGNLYAAYIWTPRRGLSAFPHYYGGGAGNPGYWRPTGFLPQWGFVKHFDGAGANSVVMGVPRSRVVNAHNTIYTYQYLNVNGAAQDGGIMNFGANHIRPMGIDDNVNNNGGQYVGAFFADAPTCLQPGR